jgi:hypothetical protein
MFWFKRKMHEKMDTEAIIFDVVHRPHKGELLDECENDLQRRSLCLQWAGELRTQWYDGLRAQVEYILTADLPRYRQYSPAAKRKIAEQVWSRSAQAKDLAATEQMYSRWAIQYSGGPGA